MTNKTKCNGKSLDYCCVCHISFGSAEPRYAIDRKGVAHKDCYEKAVLNKKEPVTRLTIH